MRLINLARSRHVQEGGVVRARYGRAVEARHPAAGYSRSNFRAAHHSRSSESDTHDQRVSSYTSDRQTQGSHVFFDVEPVLRDEFHNCFQITDTLHLITGLKSSLAGAHPPVPRSHEPEARRSFGPPTPQSGYDDAQLHVSVLMEEYTEGESTINAAEQPWRVGGQSCPASIASNVGSVTMSVTNWYGVTCSVFFW